MERRGWSLDKEGKVGKCRNETMSGGGEEEGCSERQEGRKNGRQEMEEGESRGNWIN